VALLGVDGENADGLFREGERNGEHGDKAFLAGNVGLDVALFPDHIDDGDVLVAGGRRCRGGSLPCGEFGLPR